MNLKLSLLSAALIVCTDTHTAQVSNYTFSQTIGSYGSPITGSIIGLQMAPDDVFQTSLPFLFPYNGVTYTNATVSSNGALSFSALSGSEYQPISNGVTQNVISPFGTQLIPVAFIFGDLTAGSNVITNCGSVNGFSVGDIIYDIGYFGGINPTITAVAGNSIVLSTNSASTVIEQNIPSMGKITQMVSGTTPNRICWFEYRSFCRGYDDTDTIPDEVLNFKIKLYETSGRIEFIYDMASITTTFVAAEVGLKGTSNADFNTRTTSFTNPWSNSAASAIITDGCLLNGAIYPVSGQTYAWLPVNCVTPTLAVIQTPTSSCAGQTVVLSVIGASNYSWTNGSISSQQTVTPITTTNYTVTGSVAGGCTGSLVVTHTVVQYPVLSVARSRTISCPGQVAVLTASGASTYSWSGGQSSAQVSVTPNTTTIYTVTGTSSGCSSTLSVTQTVGLCTGINDDLASDQVSVYPNPFHNELHLSNNNSIEMNVTIVDALGKTVYKTSVRANSNEIIQTEFLNNGLYFLNLSDGTINVTKKIVKN